MAWVYRYIDLADDIIKYVGVVWGKSRTLAQRLREHEKNDKWCYTRRWRIEYITNDIETRAEAEAFETHYIALYDTGKYFNVRQVGYGTNKFLPDRENDWIEFDIDKVLKEGREQTFVQISRLNKELFNLNSVINTKKKELNVLVQKIDALKNECQVDISTTKKNNYDIVYDDNDTIFLIRVYKNMVSTNHYTYKEFRMQYSMRRQYIGLNAIRTVAYHEIDHDEKTQYYYVFWGETIEEAYDNCCKAIRRDINQYLRRIGEFENDKLSEYAKRKYGSRENYIKMFTDKYNENINILQDIVNQAATL